MNHPVLPVGFVEQKYKITKIHNTKIQIQKSHWSNSVVMNHPVLPFGYVERIINIGCRPVAFALGDQQVSKAHSQHDAAFLLEGIRCI